MQDLSPSDLRSQFAALRNGRTIQTEYPFMAEQGNHFTDLTWDDLRQWAGAKILSRGKNYVNNVSEISRTDQE